MLGLRTLVLAPDYTPVESIFADDIKESTIPVEQAIVRVLKDNATCLLTHRKILMPEKHNLFWPSVIVDRAFYKKYNDVQLKHETLFYRDHGICQYCEGELRLDGKKNKITCDHVVPDSKGGKFEWENIVAACARCNQEKDDQLPKGKWKPLRMPYKPSLHELLARRRKFPVLIDDMAWLDYIGGDTGWLGEVKIRNAARRALEGTA